MHDKDCVDFLQWALPQLHMRWPGFRKVRNQVCKRLTKRIRQLDLENVAAYKARLRENPQEWHRLDGLCRVTVTRFYRDRSVYEALTREILPILAGKTLTTEDKTLRCWSIGCASGEEPYTLTILWREQLAGEFPDIHFEVLATEADAKLIARAHRACYPDSALKNLPGPLRLEAFHSTDEHYCLRRVYRDGVTFRRQDIRIALPEGLFHLILCRNLVFTYFDVPLQRQLLQQLRARLQPAGWLILGLHEKLPAESTGFSVVSEHLGLYRKQ